MNDTAGRQWASLRGGTKPGSLSPSVAAQTNKGLDLALVTAPDGSRNFKGC